MRTFLVTALLISSFNLIAADKKSMVLMKTTFGDIEIELFDEKAPETVKNFLRYVDEGFYKGTIFHRVIDNFMMQGGGFTRDFKRRPTHNPVKNEAHNGLTNDRGTIAMARTNIVDSATSQFFINFKDNNFLNHTSKTPQGYGYCVFGRVVKGMSVVNRVAKVKVAPQSGHRHAPTTPIIIESIVRMESVDSKK